MSTIAEDICKIFKELERLDKEKVSFKGDDDIPYAVKNHGLSAIDLLVNKGASLQNDVIVKGIVPFGGFKSGETIEEGTTFTEYVEKALSKFIFSKFTSIDIIPSGVREVGEPTTIIKANVKWINNENNNPPSSVYITGEGFDSFYTLPQGVSETDINASSGTVISKGSEGVFDWVLKGKNKNGEVIDSKSFSIHYYYRRFFGASSIILIDQNSFNAIMDDMSQTVLDGKRAYKYTATSENNDVNKYTYIIFSSEYPDLNSIEQDYALPVLGAFDKMPGVYNHTNSFGTVVSYKVYKSKYKGAFSIDTVLDIK